LLAATAASQHEPDNDARKLWPFHRDRK
jgi:hypothetical protein